MRIRSRRRGARRNVIIEWERRKKRKEEGSAWYFQSHDLLVVHTRCDRKVPLHARPALIDIDRWHLHDKSPLT
jgi:hypothetical protein